MEGIRAVGLAVFALAQLGPVDPTAGRVAIEMTAQDGRVLLGERYVALVSSESRWREPTVEQLIPPGEPLPELSPPPGRYRLLCSEADHWWVHGQEFEVTSGELTQQHCTMRPLVPLSGRVVTVGATGVAGAKIGHVHGFLGDFKLKLSPLGESHSRTLRTTRTDAEGRFSLLGPADGRVPLWVEADGHRPRLLELVRFPERGGDLGDITLERGGALRLALSNLGDLDLEGYRLTLVPEGAIPSNERPWARLGEHVWAKPIPSTRFFELEWSGLPARDFEVWLVPRDIRSLRATPQELETVSIHQGRETRASLEIPRGLNERPAGGVEEKGSSLRLRVLRGGDLGPFTLRRWRHDDGWEPVSGLVRADTQGTMVVVPEGCRSGWTYVLESATLVSEPVGLSGSDCGGEEVVELSLFPAGEVEGRFVPPKGVPLPRQARIELVLCKRREPVTRPLGLLPSTLRGDGRWAARLPAGCLSLEASFDAFAPENWRNVSIEEGESTKLPARTLSAGATVFARIISSSDGRGVAGAKVSLVPEKGFQSEVRKVFSSGVAQESVLPSTLTNSRGWAVVPGLDGGTFRLKIEVDTRAWPHFIGPIEVHRGRETVLEYVQIPEPARLEVELQGPDSVLPEEPGGELRVAVSGAAGCGWLEWVTITQPVAGARTVLFSDLPSGSWTVTLLRMGDRGLAQPLGSARVDLPAGEWKGLELNVDRAVFHGVVTYRGEPVHGVLELARHSGPDRERVRTNTDDHGRFSVPVRTAGRFTAKVIAQRTTEEDLFAVVPDVALDEPSEEVHIEVPDGRLSGVVLNGDGHTVGGVAVRFEQVREVRRLSGSSESFAEPMRINAVSGELGRFEVEALAPGEWHVQARSQDGRSRVISVRLSEGGVRDDLVLRLDEEGVRGRLLGPSGEPIESGLARAEFLPTQGSNPELIPFRPAADGEFELKYPGLDEIEINLGINAPGYPAFAVRALGADLMDITAPVLGGTVEFMIGGESWSGLAMNQLALVGMGGEYLQLSLLEGRIQQVEGRVSIHGLATGRWRLVRAQSLQDARSLVAGFGATLPSLASFELRGGDTARVLVRLPEASARGGGDEE